MALAPGKKGSVRKRNYDSANWGGTPNLIGVRIDPVRTPCKRKGAYLADGGGHFHLCILWKKEATEHHSLAFARDPPDRPPAFQGPYGTPQRPQAGISSQEPHYQEANVWVRMIRSNFPRGTKDEKKKKSILSEKGPVEGPPRSGVAVGKGGGRFSRGSGL